MDSSVSSLTVMLAVLAGGEESQRERMDPLSRELLFPRAYEVAAPEFARLHPETVHFENAQGAQLRGLWFEGGDSDRTVLVCMGNTGNASWMAPHAAILADAGFDVLLFDYQGFGASEGIASLLTLPGDALAAWTFLTTERGRTPQQIGVLGISLGSVLALQLAAEQQPRACAVEDLFLPDQQLAGFTGETTPGIKVALAGLRGLVLPKIDPRANARKFKGPLFLMHGDLDWLLTPMATVELAKGRPENTRTWVLAQTGHSPDSLQVDEFEYRDQLAGFFADAFDSATLTEPRVTFTTIAAPSEPAHATRRVAVDEEESVQVDLQLAPDGPARPARVKLHVTSPRAGPLQITLVAPGPEPTAGDVALLGGVNLQFHHERRVVPAGATDLEVDLSFVPTHATAVFARHAKESGAGEWEPELSPLSRSMAEVAEFREAFARAGSDLKCSVEWKTAAGLYKRALPRLAPSQWPAIRRLLPAADSLHPRARPPVAAQLAEISRQLAWAADATGDPDGAAVDAAERMLAYLPDDPRNFVTLGNAIIDVGFGTPQVRSALTRVLEARLQKGDVEGAQAVLRELVKYVEDDPARARLEELQLRAR